MSIILGLISSVIWARMVPVDTYGHYKVILSWIGIISSFSFSGFSESLRISAAKRYDGNLLKILKIRGGITLLGAIVLGAAAFFYRASQPALAAGLFLAALLFPLYKLQDIWLSWLLGRGKLNRWSFYQIGISVLQMVGLVAFAATGLTALPNLLIAIIGVPSLISLFIMVSILRGRTNRDIDRETIQFGLHASFVIFLTSLANTDTIIINRYLSPADVAVYAIALIFPKQIKSLYGIFGQLFAPQIYKAESVAEAWDYLRDKFVILMGVFVLIGVVGFVAVPIFVPMLFSERYASAVPYAKWMWLSLAVTGPTVYLGNVLRAQQKVKFVYGYSIAYYVLLFGAYLILVRFGLTGMVLARSAMYIISALIYVVGFVYYLRFSSTESIGRETAVDPEPDCSNSHYDLLMGQNP